MLVTWNRFFFLISFETSHYLPKNLLLAYYQSINIVSIWIWNYEVKVIECWSFFDLFLSYIYILQQCDDQSANKSILVFLYSIITLVSIIYKHFAEIIVIFCALKKKLMISRKRKKATRRKKLIIYTREWMSN